MAIPFSALEPAPGEAEHAVAEDFAAERPDEAAGSDWAAASEDSPVEAHRLAFASADVDRFEAAESAVVGPGRDSYLPR